MLDAHGWATRIYQDERWPDRPLPYGLVAVWASRGHLFQLEYRLDEGRDHDALIHWWFKYGRLEHAGTREALAEYFAERLHVLGGQDVTVPSLPITPFMRLVWEHRVDLQRLYDLNDPLQRMGFWSWWYGAGAQEYGFESSQVPRDFDTLLKPVDCDIAGFERIHPAVAWLIYDTRPDLQHHHHLENTHSRLTLLEWFYAHGLDEYAQLGSLIGSSVRAALSEPDPNIKGAGLPPWAAWMWRLNHAIAQPGGTGQVPSDAAAWWEAGGLKTYSALDRELRVGSSPIGTVAPPATWRSGGCDLTEPGQGAFDRPTSSQPALTANLIGYPQGEFGIGEDIRLLRRSLETAGVQARTFRMPRNIRAHPACDDQSEDLQQQPAEGLTFFAMPAFDTLALASDIGLTPFLSQYRIGFWQWELSKFPDPARIVFDLVDEIWSHSEYSAAALRERCPKPVLKMPLPVDFDVPKSARREELGLHPDQFVFLFSFDGSSFIARKNPLGCIEAFQRAFPASNRDVRLVVKAMNVDVCSLWRECLRRIEADDRIVLVDRVLAKADYYALLAACDAVVSLHRAEGFGRLIAEGLFLQKPVVATAYSGNLDYTTPETSFLVGGKLVRVMPGDYPFSSGQTWLEPDVDEAVEQMRECMENVELARRRAVAGQKLIRDRYSLAACGSVYAERLKRIIGPPRW